MMTEDQEQKLKDLKVKFAQHYATLRQTFDNSPQPNTLAWAKDVRRLTEVLDGLAIEIQEVVEDEAGT